MKKTLSLLLAILMLVSMMLTGCKDYEIPEDLEASQGLEFKKILGGYKVVGIGDCKDSEIIIPEVYNKKNVIEIDSYAFKDCTQITKVAIPSTVKKIGQQAFNGCSNLLEVYIDKGVEKLGAMLFYMSSVDKIYFNGTSDEFKEIDSGKNYNAWYYVGADWGDKAFYVYCTDVMLIYNFKDGKDTPKTEEYEITPETKTYYIPVKAELSSPKGLCSIKVDIGTNNLPKKETQTRFGELYGTCEYTYDSNGKLIKIVQKDDNGEVFGCTENKYNSSGKIIEYSLIDSTGAVNIKVECTYDNQNNLCKEVQTGQIGQKIVIIHEYNAVGLLVKTIYKYGNEESAVTYEYDANGNLIKKVDGSFTFTYTYDASGRMVKAVCPDMDANNYGKNITYAIMYDKNGNISKIVSTNASGEKETCSFEYKEVTVPLDYCMDMVTIESMFIQLNMMDNVITIVPGDFDLPQFIS